MKLNRFNNNATFYNLRAEENKDIDKIIVKHYLNNNLNNINNNSNIFFFIRKIRDILLFIVTISIISGVVIFSVVYFKDKNNKSMLSFKQNVNNTEKIDGYYIPKDKLSNPFYKKCSVENCKSCYGNSFDDICILCLNSYNPILNENSQIKECKYDPQKEEDFNITIKERDSINLTDNIIENRIEITIETDMNNLDEIKSQLITENISEIKNTSINSITNIIYENITTIGLESTIENIYIIKNISLTNINSENITSIELESSTEKILNSNFENKNELITQINTDIKPQTTSITQFEQIETTNIIINCEPGYYLPEGNNIEKICKQCSEFGCEICHGNSSVNYCDSCKNEYVLYEGKCYAYSFVCNYYTYTDNLNIKLINLNKNYIEKIIMNDKIINISNFENYLVIPNQGNHYAYFFIKNNPTIINYMFYNSVNIISVNFTSHFKTDNIIKIEYMFYLCSSLTFVDLSKFNTSNIYGMHHLFEGCYSLTSIDLHNFNTTKVVYMSGMFKNCYSLKYLDLGNMNIQSAKSFYSTFYNCSSLTSLILPYNTNSGFTLSLLNVTDEMFFNCSKLTSINLHNLNFTNVVNMSSMFEGCSSLKVINIPCYYKRYYDNNYLNFVYKLYDLTPKNVVYLKNIFYGCTSLKSINISSWNLEKVENMNYMFTNCISLETIILKEFNGYNIVNMEHMFSNCTSLKNISLVLFKNTYKVKNMSHMFNGDEFRKAN